VHDLAIHLLSADVNELAGRRDDFQERRTEPIPYDLSQWDQLLAFIDERNGAWVEVNRRLSPRLLCSLLTTTGDELDAWWPAVDLNAVGMPVNWAGPDPAPTWLHVAREYTERWVHQQQIRDALGRPGLTGPEFLRPVLDTFVLALPVALQNVPGVLGDRVKLSVSGAADRSWTVIKSDTGWRFASDSGGVPICEVTLRGDIMWRLASRTISPTEARAQAVIKGDSAAGEAVLKIVSMIVA